MSELSQATASSDQDQSQLEPENQHLEEPTETSNHPAGHIETPPAGFSNEYVGALEQQLRVQNQQIQQLLDNQTRASEPEPDPEEEKQQFYGAPTKTTRAIVKAELDVALKPLTEFVSRMEAETVYGRLKQQFKADARFASHFADPAFERIVDEIMENAEKTPQIMQTAVVQAIGLKAINAIPQSQTPAPTNERVETRVVNPPHLRPSAPAPVRNNAQPNQQPLNELEKRMARERWPDKTAEEQAKLYRNFLNLAPGDVVKADKDGTVKK